jgi:O-antigen/teichoic acid export membrane protein
VAGAAAPFSLRAAIWSQSGAQALAALISMVQVFVLVPWYLQAFGARLYGAWAASGEIFYWLQSLELGVPNILIQRIAARTAEGKPDEAGRWFGSGAAAMAGLGLVLGMAAWRLAEPVASWLGAGGADSATFITAFRLGGCATGLHIFAYAFIALARGVQRVRWMNAGQVAGALTGFAVTAAALHLGAGLPAIAYGMLARAAALCLFGALALWLDAPPALRRHTAPRLAFLTELGGLAPSTAAGAVGYAAANQSDAVLAAVFLGPESAALLAVNRRLFDAIRLAVDSLPQTSTGAFAYRAAQSGSAAALRLARQLTAIRSLTILPLAAAALALNRWFVGVWTEPRWDGGAWLTAGLAAASFLGGHSHLANALLRSTGRFRESGWLLAGEAACRWLALACAAWLGGLAWMAWAGAGVAGTAALINRRRLATALGAQDRTSGLSPAWAGAAAPLILACLANFWASAWPVVFGCAAMACSGAVLALLAGDPWLEPVRELIRLRSTNWKGGASGAREVA